MIKVSDIRDYFSHVSCVIAYPTFCTYDLGMQFNVITNEGCYTGIGQFADWPAFKVSINNKIIRFLNSERILNLDNTSLKELSLDPLIQEEEDLFILTNFLFNNKKSLISGKYFYSLRGVDNRLFLFCTLQEMGNQFFEEYLAPDYVDWSEIDDNTIENYYQDLKDINFEFYTKTL